MVFPRPIVKPFVPAFLQPKTMYQLQLTETKADEEKKESDAAEKATGMLFNLTLSPLRRRWMPFIYLFIYL